MNNLKHLLDLLDDENQQSASLVMAELLKYEDQVEPLLREIQESDNPRLRRRIHQLESIFTLRRRRKSVSKKMMAKQVDLLDGLMDLHFLWYDNDSKELLVRQWSQLIEKAEVYQPDTLEKLVYFMRKTGFSVSDKEEIEADFHCVGIVLEDLIGSDLLICAIARCLAAHFNFEVRIARTVGDFALLDSKGRFAVPRNDWRVYPSDKVHKSKKWSDRQILRHTAATLFLCAVSTDSFRYVHTIGNSLAKSFDHDNIDFLPYPFTSLEN